MLQSVPKAVSMLAAAAAIVGAATVFSGASETASVTVPINNGKGDRLDVRAVGPNCSQQAWPYYEAHCVKDSRQAMSQAKAARIVTSDRVTTSVAKTQ